VKFRRIADLTAKYVGHPATFATSIAVIVLWAISGPFFGFSDAWQLVINTGTTIITFLMVFLIQNTQNRDAMAIQAKLDELIRTSRASNTFIGVEYLTEEEVEHLREMCAQRAREGGADSRRST
jgi:low affinity Fe/Cu permease